MRYLESTGAGTEEGPPSDGANANTYTLVQTDEGNRIRVVVRYQVDGNTNQESAQFTTDYTGAGGPGWGQRARVRPRHGLPRTISEGDKGRNVGTPVTAMGNHGTVRYSLDDTAGDALAAGPRFEIDDKTGQITTTVDLDYEAVNPATADAAGSVRRCDGTTPDRECTVTVTARDSTGEAATNTAP